ncbi:MAG: UbiA family prenyltransferase [Sphingobacteriales bacterium]|nr:UbiA family prenyltransferase [Sphingobacteriales bacterium]
MMWKKFVDFIIYSNLFIAACSLALTYETFCLFRLPASLNWYLLLMFLCTVFVYSLHYFVKSKKQKNDSRLAWCRQNRQLLLTLIVLSFIFIAGGVVWHYRSIFISHDKFNYRNLIWFIVIPLLSLGYSYPLNPWNKKSLRQTGWLKMASLSFIWSFTTVVLPVLMWPEENITGTIQLVVLFFHRAFFIAALSILFNVSDYDEDKKDEIKTIAVMAGPEKTLQYGKWIMTALNSITAWLLLYYFQLSHPVYIASVFLPVLLLFLLYHFFHSGEDKASFALRYDGLMILKALLLIFAALSLSS